MSQSPLSVGAVTPALSPTVSPIGSAPKSTAVAASGQTAFESVLRQLSNDAVDSLKVGEATALAGLQGKASTREVVDAVMRAEQSLQTVIAVRDKVISAYQEISRMQI